MKRLLSCVTLSIMMGACSMTLPVQGLVQGTGETFAGSATGEMDGGGTLTIRSAKTSCTGAFVYVTRREGKGTFNCADGRSGPFEFVSTGTRGTGFGDLGGQKFTFTFG
ncbi:MAG: hypothetical protein JWN07_841 [Hyphomicrobiales bacterium]|nr:hypothetical protein [Hyphomicrobiales bacterium]